MRWLPRLAQFLRQVLLLSRLVQLQFLRQVLPLLSRSAKFLSQLLPLLRLGHFLPSRSLLPRLVGFPPPRSPWRSSGAIWPWFSSVKGKKIKPIF